MHDTHDDGHAGPADTDAVDEWDDLDELEPEYEPRWGLPLRAGSFVDGIPRVTVDYFAFSARDRDAIVNAITAMDRVLRQDPLEGDLHGDPTLYFVEHGAEEGLLDPRAIVGIVEFRGERLRLETNRDEHTVALRAALEAALGDRIRHRVRAIEDPLAP